MASRSSTSNSPTTLSSHTNNNTIIVEKNETVILLDGSSSNEAICVNKVCNFIKPCVASCTNEQLISPPPSINLTTTTIDRALCDDVNFRGRHIPSKNWKSWVQAMHSKHHLTWKQAGIEKSILSSVYRIVKQNDVILEVAHKWCPKTNTFIFPSGVSTITLEDIMVLGGFSVLGHSVLTPLVDDDDDDRHDLLRRVEMLEESWRIVKGSRSERSGCSPTSWIQYFMGKGAEVEEHEAFLVFWLLRFVFPNDGITRDVFPIAIRLSKGRRLALGPAVLASIYRDLSKLKLYILSRKDISQGKTLFLRAPFQLVQLWVWERFPTLSPKPGLIRLGEPRAARWCDVDLSKDQQVRFSIDNVGGYFQWRPYAAALSNWQPPEFYREECCNIPSPSSVAESDVNKITTSIKNTKKKKPETSREKSEKGTEDRIPSNVHSLVGEPEHQRENVDINMTSMVKTSEREKIVKSMEYSIPYNVVSFVADPEQTREDVNVNPTLNVKNTEKNMQLEADFDNVEKSMESMPPVLGPSSAQVTAALEMPNLHETNEILPQMQKNDNEYSRANKEHVSSDMEMSLPESFNSAEVTANQLPGFRTTQAILVQAANYSDGCEGLAQNHSIGFADKVANSDQCGRLIVKDADLEGCEKTKTVSITQVSDSSTSQAHSSPVRRNTPLLQESPEKYNNYIHGAENGGISQVGDSSTSQAHSSQVRRNTSLLQVIPQEINKDNDEAKNGGNLNDSEAGSSTPAVHMQSSQTELPDFVLEDRIAKLERTFDWLMKLYPQ
ncbi:hypothetical protein ACFE04_023283 [Oxalis oulophora]